MSNRVRRDGFRFSTCAAPAVAQDYIVATILPTSASTALRAATSTFALSQYDVTISGFRFGGQRIAMSLLAVWPEPVLSASRQSAGNPARSESAPVLFAVSQRVNRSREPCESASPSNNFCMSPSIAHGVVVSSSLFGQLRNG